MLVALVAVATAVASEASAQTDAGQALLSKNCGRCHGILPGQASRHPAAPTFQRVMKRYPASMLAEALAEGLSTGHPDMPEFSFSPDQVAAIIRYLDGLPKE